MNTGLRAQSQLSNKRARTAHQQRTSMRCALASVLASTFVFDFAEALEVGGPGVTDNVKLKAVYERKETPASDPRDLPKLALALPLNADWEIEFSVKRRDVSLPNDTSKSGLGDSEIKTKWAITKADKVSRTSGLALETKLILPTGDAEQALGGGHTRLNLALLAGRPAAPFGYSAKFAYEHGFGRTNHELTTGVAGHYRLSRSIELGSEIYLKTPATNPDRATYFAATGLKWKPASRWEVHGVLGRSLHRPAAGREMKTKLTIQYAFE
jgi:hypothetical protein